LGPPNLATARDQRRPGRLCGAGPRTSSARHGLRAHSPHKHGWQPRADAVVLRQPGGCKHRHDCHQDGQRRVCRDDERRRRRRAGRRRRAWKMTLSPDAFKAAVAARLAPSPGAARIRVRSLCLGSVLLAACAGPGLEPPNGGADRSSNPTPVVLPTPTTGGRSASGAIIDSGGTPTTPAAGATASSSRPAMGVPGPAGANAATGGATAAARPDSAGAASTVDAGSEDAGADDAG
jgi:hypothetical protein